MVALFHLFVVQDDNINKEEQCDHHRCLLEYRYSMSNRGSQYWPLVKLAYVFFLSKRAHCLSLLRIRIRFRFFADPGPGKNLSADPG